MLAACVNGVGIRLSRKEPDFGTFDVYRSHVRGSIRSLHWDAFILPCDNAFERFARGVFASKLTFFESVKLAFLVVPCCVIHILLCFRDNVAGYTCSLSFAAGRAAMYVWREGHPSSFEVPRFQALHYLRKSVIHVVASCGFVKLTCTPDVAERS